MRKKLKDKAFARSVSRDDIVDGARELGIDLDEHIAFCIQAMAARARELGRPCDIKVEPALGIRTEPRP